MRLLQGVSLISLSGLVAGVTQPAAEVYIFEANRTSSPQAPQLPKEIARHIFLQRTSGDPYGDTLCDIPDTSQQGAVIDFIATYGKNPARLFKRASVREPSQLVVFLEGTTNENLKPLMTALSELNQQPAFTIANPPSTSGNTRLVSDFRIAGASTPTNCAVEFIVNPFDLACWGGSTAAARYDMQKEPRAVQTLADNLDRLSKFVSNGDLEVVLVLVPESSRASGPNTWTDSRSIEFKPELRRRDSELITSEPGGSALEALPTWHSLADGTDGWATADLQRAARAIPQCFSSESTCMSQTRNCSGHGFCQNKNGNDASSAVKDSCFACVCQSTIIQTGDEPGQAGRLTQHWGGNMCQKKDVSVPFWLLAGFAVGIICAVSSAIGLLFALGEEKLPGVIGAGVSRK